MSDRSRVSSENTKSADKLSDLSHKLKSVLDRGKDVTREKYVEIYQKCIALRKDVENAAIEALDNGNSVQFDNLATLMHTSSAIIEEYENRVTDGGKILPCPDERSDAGFTERSIGEGSGRGDDDDSRRRDEDEIRRREEEEEEFRREDESKRKKDKKKPKTHWDSSNARDFENWATFDDDDYANDGLSGLHGYSERQSVRRETIDTSSRRSTYQANASILREGNLDLVNRASSGYDESLLLYYIQLLEECLEYSGSTGLFKKLRDSPIDTRVDILKEYLKLGSERADNKSFATCVGGVNSPTSDFAPSVTKFGDSANLHITNYEHVSLPRLSNHSASDEMYKLNIPDGYIVEPLWREVPDGGQSNYMGNYLIKGGDLYECMKYIVRLNVDHFVSTEGFTNVKIRLMSKVQGLDVSISLKGFKMDNESLVSSYNLKRDVEMVLDGEIDLRGIPHGKWPGLELITIESDGSKSSLFLDLPIGLFSLSLPIKFDFEHFNHLWNSVEYASSKQVRIFSSKTPLMIHDLIPICARLFSINVYSDVLIMSASGSDTVLAVIYIEGSNLIVLQIRTLCTILQHNFFSALKEMLATINADKTIAKCNRIFGKLPCPFDKPFSRVTHNSTT